MLDIPVKELLNFGSAGLVTLLFWWFLSAKLQSDKEASERFNALAERSITAFENNTKALAELKTVLDERLPRGGR